MATEAAEGIDPRSRTPIGRDAQDVHQFITRKHENTARCPNEEVLPVYAVERPVQTFKLAPKAIRWRGAGDPGRHRRHRRRDRGRRAITL